MNRRFNPSDKPDPRLANLPDCFCCTFVVLEEVRLKRGRNRFSGLYAAFRFWHPPANRQLVMHHTDGFVGES